jgi:hypothetical protein
MNNVRFACLSLIQLVSIVAVYLVASLYGFRGIDPDNMWVAALVVGTLLGVIFMAWKGTKSDVFVMGVSPMISSEILTENGHRLSAIFSQHIVNVNYVTVYMVIVVPLIWVVLAVVMRLILAGIRRAAC